VPRHFARLVTRLVAPLVVDYSSSTTSPSSRVRVARHVARLVTRLVAPLVVDYLSPTTSSPPRVRVPRHVAQPVTRLIIDYSVRRDFVLRPRWLYFIHTVRGDYLPCANTGSTSSTPRAATTSSSGHIASTIHLD
jgi:hypothetical protein